VNKDGQNDIDISRINTSSDNNDYTMGGSKKLQASLTDLITEYEDIYSYSVKGSFMDVPHMEFKVDDKSWESSGNRMASRQISIEKQVALKTLIDDLLEKEVIRSPKATAWSQVKWCGNLVAIYYRAINKAITNQGWQIPNMKDMLQRIGSLKPRVLGVAAQRFYQMPP